MFFAIVAKEITDKKLGQKITNKYRKNLLILVRFVILAIFAIFVSDFLT